MRSVCFSLLLLSCALMARGQINPHTQIRWPSPSCSTAGQVYDLSSNTCIPLSSMSGQVAPSTQINWPGSCTTAGTVYSLQSNSCVALSGLSGQVAPNTQINWPVSCNAAGMVYNSQTNTCVAIGGVSWRGAWSAGTYAANDLVSYLGSTYISTAAGNTATPPSSPWSVVAQAGATGPAGPTFDGGTIHNPLIGTTASFSGVTVTSTPTNPTDAATVAYVGSHSGVTTGLVGPVTKATDAAWGVSALNTAAQNKTAFAAIAAAVNAGTTPSYIYIPEPTPVAITAWSITSNVVTFTAANTFAANQVVLITGLSTGQYLNTRILTVTGATSTQFTAAFTHANASSTENGIATPAYSVDSTGGFSLGNITVPFTLHCADPSNTILYQTGTGGLIDVGKPGLVWLTDLLNWTPTYIENCMFTGGASATEGIRNESLFEDLYVLRNHFYNYGNASMYAVHGHDIVELWVNDNFYYRTDSVAGNFIYAEDVSHVWTMLHALGNFVQCHISATDGNTIICGSGIVSDGLLEASGNEMSGPSPNFRCGGKGNNPFDGDTCGINGNYMETVGPYSITYGMPSAGSNEYIYNVNIQNNRIAQSVSLSSAVGPASTHSALVGAVISGNTLRHNSFTNSPFITLNNIAGQTGNIARGNANIVTLHSTGTNITAWDVTGAIGGANIGVTDNNDGTATIASSTVGPNCGTYQAYDSFFGGATTPLSAHADTCAHFWVSYGAIDGSSGAITLTGSNSATTVSTGADYYLNMTPSSANYTVAATCTVTVAGSNCKVMGRCSTGVWTCYDAVYIGGTGFQLYKVVAGVATQLGSTYSGITSGTHTMALGMSGTAITVSVDGTSRISVTDSAVTAVGVPVFGLTGNSSPYESASLFTVQ